MLALSSSTSEAALEEILDAWFAAEPLQGRDRANVARLDAIEDGADRAISACCPTAARPPWPTRSPRST